MQVLRESVNWPPKFLLWEVCGEGFPIARVVTVAMWKWKPFGVAEQHLSLPRLATEEFELLGVAELESKCT